MRQLQHRGEPCRRVNEAEPGDEHGPRGADGAKKDIQSPRGQDVADEVHQHGDDGRREEALMGQDVLARLRGTRRVEQSRERAERREARPEHEDVADDRNERALSQRGTSFARHEPAKSTGHPNRD